MSEMPVLLFANSVRLMFTLCLFVDVFWIFCKRRQRSAHEFHTESSAGHQILVTKAKSFAAAWGGGQDGGHIVGGEVGV